MRGASRGAPAALVTLDNLEPIAGPRGGDVSFECLPYQLSMGEHYCYWCGADPGVNLQEVTITQTLKALVNGVPKPRQG
ncbi:uncharacterized protein AKAME5_002993400 [Lates japonicus]|uniref:Uncharacterized protein n=1 Tax=Lates japonicus TaxID=270547 RepID=A0AAD3MUA1_LATJO|nr:uncharacterized protein AKAME5_002993400 [Lates japonicus]